jgi:hypothetical protein
MISPTSRFFAVVEVVRQPDGDVQGDVIAAAYRASAAVPVLLVLDRVSRAEADKVLDHVVTRSQLNRPGVRYAEADDEVTVLEAAKNARRIFASSDRFRAKLDARRLPYQDLTELDSISASFVP